MAFELDELNLEKHVKIILNTYFTDVFETHESFNFRCNICGDSKKDRFKKRGYILKKTPWVYYCHNGDCNASLSVINWMKEYYPSNYKAYIRDVMRNKKEKDDKVYKNIKTQKAQVEFDEKAHVKFFKPITNFPDAVDFCKGRKIPYDVYRRWRYAIDGKYKGRIIITFLNDKGKSYYYQGRKFNNNSGVKYLSRHGDHNSIYNYYVVDPDKPVPVLEGPIDSIFVENSIAVTGIKLRDDRLDKFPKKYYILDNDKAGWVNSTKLLKQRSYVFNWKKFLADYPCKGEIKDVNDFILARDDMDFLSWDIIEKYFTNNSNDKFYFIGSK